MVSTITLLFTQNFSSQVLISKSFIWVQMITLGLFRTQNEILVWIWSITFSMYFGKTKVPIFVSKCYTALILPKKNRMDTERIVFGLKHSAYMFWDKNILLRFQRILLTLFKQFLYSFIQNNFLTCFDFKISHLGPNDFLRHVLDLKWNLGLDLKHNIDLTF